MTLFFALPLFRAVRLDLSGLLLRAVLLPLLLPFFLTGDDASFATSILAKEPKNKGSCLRRRNKFGRK